MSNAQERGLRQLVPLPPSGPSRLMLAAIGGGALILLLSATTVAVYLLVPGIRGSEPENTARYFPRDTYIYNWATFSPGIGQGRRMLDLWNRFEELPKFEEEVDELLEDLEDETGIDFEEEVLPWIGPDMSLAVMNASGESFDVVALVGVKDHDAATDFLHDLLEYMEDEGVELAQEDDVHGFEVWADWDSDTALALSGDWLLFANAEDALKDVLGRISGEERQSLADSASFQEARSAMNDNRAMSLFIDLEAATDAFWDLAGADVSADINTPDWLAASVGFIDRGIVMEAVAPFDADFLVGFNIADDPANLLPDDTLFFWAAAFEPDVDEWRAELEEYTVADLIGPETVDELTELVSDDFEGEITNDSTLAEALDYVIDLVDESIDIHLEKELLDHLGGQAVLGVRDFDLDRVEDTEDYAVDVVAALSYLPGTEESLMRTVEKLVDLLEEAAGEEFPARISKGIGADHEAVMFGTEDNAGETAYSPGYVFHDGYMTVGSTERALKAAVDSQSDNAGALAASREYRTARESLPDILELLVFFDLHRLIVQLDPDSLDIQTEEFEILEKALGAVAMGVSTDTGYSRASFVLTLFP